MGVYGAKRANMVYQKQKNMLDKAISADAKEKAVLKPEDGLDYLVK